MEDSGKRQEFNTGAVRDTAEGKPRPDLISPYAQMRKGAWLAKGAQKYKERNWEAGMPISRCIASTERHLQEYKMGLTNEDHLAAVAVNIEFIMHYEAMIAKGLLPAELDDMPRYEQQVKCDCIIAGEATDGIRGKCARDLVSRELKQGEYHNEVKTLPKITAYLSHPIRGEAGQNATRKEMEANCIKAKEFAKELQDEFPELDIYVPAEMDDYLLLRGIEPKDMADSLLRLDCEIIKSRDLLIVYQPDLYISPGMRREVNYAEDLGKRIYMTVGIVGCKLRLPLVLREIRNAKIGEI